MRLVLLGAPGSGKGTQGTALADRYGVPHVSSGDLLRRHVADATPLGRDVAGYLARGELVPDDLVLAVVGQAVLAAAAIGGYVLDGFPRTLAQAERAYELAGEAGITADAVVYLAVPDDVARQRMAGRAFEGRLDDRDPEVIERRLRVFHAETEPLLDFYRGRGILVQVDATGTPDEVTAATVAALAASAPGRAGLRITRLDDVSWQEVKAQLHGERRVSIHEKYLEWSPNLMVLYARYEPGMLVERHGHRSDHLVYVLEGEIIVGGEVCGPGTNIVLEHGAVFGPIEAGPDGALLYEVMMGDPRSVPADPDGFARLLADRGITPLPNPPVDAPPWFGARTDSDPGA